MKNLLNLIVVSILMMGGCTTFAKTFCQENHVLIKNTETGEETKFIMIFLKDPEFDIHHSYCFKHSHDTEIDCWVMEKAIHDAFTNNNYTILDRQSGKMSCLI